jgi:uncharacterized protein with HEPN domain
MPKSDWIYLEHMLDMCQKALEMTAGKTRLDYDESEILQYALAHVIQVIGEAADHVSAQFKEGQPQIPWHEIIGMRHRIVHDYMNVDEDVVWSVVRNDLPSLVTILIITIPTDML